MSVQAIKANNRPGNQLEPALSQTGIDTVVPFLLLPLSYLILVINRRVSSCVLTARLCTAALGAASTSDDEVPPPSDDDDELPASRDQPHLKFEITSEDGFSVEADSVEGKKKKNSL